MRRRTFTHPAYRLLVAAWDRAWVRKDYARCHRCKRAYERWWRADRSELLNNRNPRGDAALLRDVLG